MKILISILLSIVVAVPAFAEHAGIITDVKLSDKGTLATFIECSGKKQTVFIKDKKLSNYNVVKFNSTERKELYNQTGNKVSVLIINDAEVVLK